MVESGCVQFVLAVDYFPLPNNSPLWQICLNVMNKCVGETYVDSYCKYAARLTFNDKNREVHVSEEVLNALCPSEFSNN